MNKGRITRVGFYQPLEGSGFIGGPKRYPFMFPNEKGPTGKAVRGFASSNSNCQHPDLRSRVGNQNGFMQEIWCVPYSE